MTDAAPADNAIDIVDEADGPGAELNRQADAFLAENARRRPVSSVRAAVREDLSGVRQAARARTLQMRDQIAETPRKSVLYALGAGVLLGLILAR